MPATRTSETKTQSGDKVQSGKGPGATGGVKVTAQPDLTPGTNLFMQRYLGNTRLQAISGPPPVHGTEHSIQCK